MEKSMSVTKGNGNINHNLRRNKKIPANVDPSKTDLNLVIVHQKMRDVYADIFGAAVEEYNLKQKRNDRKIHDYYLKISHDKKTDLFKELVIQVGSKDDPVGDVNLTNEIFSEFVEEFQKKNPQMVVVGAYVHNDEATPHLHLDYVAVADYHRGLKKRVANNRAIEQMGYQSWQEWKDTQFSMLQEICHRHGIQRKVMDNHLSHLSVSEYKQKMDAINNAAIVDSAQRVEKKPSDEVSYEDYLLMVDRYNVLVERTNALHKKALADDMIIADQGSQIERFRRKSFVKENEDLQFENESLGDVVEHLNDVVDDYVGNFVPKKELDAAKEELVRKDRQIADLEKENGVLRRFIDEMGLGGVFDEFREIMQHGIDFLHQKVGLMKYHLLHDVLHQTDDPYTILDDLYVDLDGSDDDSYDFD